MTTAYQSLLKETQLPGAVIQQIQARYREPVRTYHSEQHLIRIANYIEDHALKVSQAQAVAILFHDAVYVPGAREGINERLSAQLLEVLCTPFISPDTLACAAQIILDTIDHLPTRDESALVLDLDLLGMAQDIESVMSDSALIFEEVQNLVSGRDEYDTLRRSFFLTLLERQRILHSDELDHYETVLRNNLIHLTSI